MVWGDRRADMAGVHDRCLQLASEALDCLQAPKKGSVSTAIRKLELCARLLGDCKLLRWCEFHLGGWRYALWGLEDEKAEPREKQIINLIAEDKLPVSIGEALPRVFEAGGGFDSIEMLEEVVDRLRKEKAGNDGTRYLNNVLKTISACANAAMEHASRLYAQFSFGDIPRRQFDVIRERVDGLLLDICPQAVKQFMSAYHALGSGSSEDWSLALTACRRVIKSVADALFPPVAARDGRALGEEQYINRLWAFLDDNVPAGSDKLLAKAHVDYLGSFLQRLNEKASKGVHEAVTYEEAVRAVLYTYLTLGDILEFAGVGVKQILASTGKQDLNSASIENLCRVPGIRPAFAKEIVRRRAKVPFASTKELADIKGFGPRTLAKAEPYLTVIQRSSAS
ncbi:MAG: helix-hairpin-helix domain-containing protein [Armatimonadetes bacterium]|nr:helix-hairpin-helix domain-containing protein [Armatimonadota bacterium]